MDKNHNLENILELIGLTIKEVLKGETLIIFFGSLVKGGFNRTSDIDVAIFTGNRLSAKTIMEIEKALENLPTFRSIDLIDLGRVDNPELIEEVLSEGLIWKSSAELLNALRKRLESLRKP